MEQALRHFFIKKILKDMETKFFNRYESHVAYKYTYDNAGPKVTLAHAAMKDKTGKPVIIVTASVRAEVDIPEKIYGRVVAIDRMVSCAAYFHGTSSRFTSVGKEPFWIIEVNNNSIISITSTNPTEVEMRYQQAGQFEQLNAALDSLVDMFAENKQLKAELTTWENNTQNELNDENQPEESNS